MGSRAGQDRLLAARRRRDRLRTALRRAAFGWALRAARGNDGLGAAQRRARRWDGRLRPAVRRRARRGDRLGTALRRARQAARGDDGLGAAQWQARRGDGRLCPALRRRARLCSAVWWDGLDARRRGPGVARWLATPRALRRHPARLVVAEGAIVVRAAFVPGPVVARSLAAGRELVRGRVVAAGTALVARKAVVRGGPVAARGALVAGQLVVRDRAVATGSTRVADRAVLRAFATGGALVAGGPAAADRAVVDRGAVGAR
ncbi:hypothetical protein [Amycolatopsis sp. Hca4]|uniref:hypothetical protein n=1 Tax=Amycolatopsis sp. Hca4 TaxID=2742131 RepID=UPI0015912F3C|nr:hypothetical protein [Amycolatopsis sp. Hca4]QKV77116.1 hypothetical protein HUT10_27570 [Amycolatopsis sp. Hca4]